MAFQRIQLRLENGVWIARHTDPAVRELFGTSDIPTPFGGTIAPAYVLSQITALNPNVIVEFEA